MQSSTWRVRSCIRCELASRLTRPRHRHRHHTPPMDTNASAAGEQRITRVLFCGPHFPASHEYTTQYLQSHSFIKVDVLPLEHVPQAIPNYHVCIVKSMKLDSHIISRAARMQLIMQYGVGIEGVDVEAATKHGIKVARIQSHATGNSASCAEMAIYLMLGLLRKQNELQISIQQRKLGEPITETLLGKTIFILGFGNIGMDLAHRLRPFGVKVIATKRSWTSCTQHTSKLIRSNVDDLVDERVNHEDMYKFVRKADIIVCCLRLNSETAGIINNDFISSMKKGALLVNIARGGLMDYEAVVKHLESGHLGGLGTDVAWNEPFNPDDQILKFKNVIMTPHVAGVTEHSYRTMAKAVGDVVLQLHAGQPLTGIEIVN
ncbi:hypothetical protein HN51_053098 [Arachis hypogaea]|uniref:D-isomer specific 2-hydroxyacid dehydrogenase NAD-binding domain-containing protein n=1 Tax=Arachis hypogaea TaxID=3818 RepID=A0A444XBC6_ARAHY|nr:uncharacterized protein LOC107645077 [Arachis ipaensis]XP_025657274.1 uncharacterized protein LOC112752091 [Arachis hypogaea]RYQ86996.1 hypothetical protein Ahy_B09g094499 isoform C [Arachis hypogaea]